MYKAYEVLLTSNISMSYCGNLIHFSQIWDGRLTQKRLTTVGSRRYIMIYAYWTGLTSAGISGVLKFSLP